MKTKWTIALCAAVGGALCWFTLATSSSKVEETVSPSIALASELAPATRMPEEAVQPDAAAQAAGHTNQTSTTEVSENAARAGSNDGLARWQFATGWGRETNPTLRAFSAWTERYLNTTAEAERNELLSEGLKLAAQRSVAIKELIMNDPRAALAGTVPARIRQQLPVAVQARLEERVSGHGSFAVLAASPAKANLADFRPIERRVTLNGRSFRAHTFGHRNYLQTKSGVSLHGVALDGEMAVSDSPLRLLESDESPDPAKPADDKRCPVSRREAADVATVVESGTRTYWLCSGGHLEKLEDTVSATEGLLQAAMAYQNLGAKRVLVMLVDFPDRPGGPVSGAAAAATMNQVNDFFRANAFGQMWFSEITVTPVLRMPWTSDAYPANDDFMSLLAHAREAALAAGISVASYEFDVVAFTGIGFGWGGLGFVGAKGAWVQGDLYAGTTAHEIGHNLGLWHAGFWNATDGIGLDGKREEYGNIFDVMGNASSFPIGHFSANFKRQLGWLPEDLIYTTAAAGSYRLYAMDAGGGLRSDRRYALRIPAGVPVLGLSVDYWIDYRTALRASGSGVEGATVQWGATEDSPNASLLIDTTPGSANGKRDANIAVGTSFFDGARKITITVVGRGGSGSDAYLDVRLGNPSPVNLTDALDLAGAGWTSSGNAAWQGQSGLAHDGTDAARAGAIADGQTSSIQTSFTGPGTLTFWWKVSSEQRFDLLKLFIDGREVESVSGEVDWHQRSHELDSGNHTVRWVFVKDGSVSIGQDSGWLDEVAFTGGAVGATLYVDGRYTGASSDGSLARPFRTVSVGSAAMTACGTLRIRGGSYPGALVMTKCMKLESYGGRVVLGDTTPDGFQAQRSVGLGTPVHQSDGSVKIGFSGEPGRTYEVLISTNLVSWQSWKSFVAEEASFDLIDPSARQTSRRFFKLVPR